MAVTQEVNQKQEQLRLLPNPDLFHKLVPAEIVAGQVLLFGKLFLHHNLEESTRRWGG
jgi:hypothetical protein